MRQSVATMVIIFWPTADQETIIIPGYAQTSDQIILPVTNVSLA